MVKHNRFDRRVDAKSQPGSSMNSSDFGSLGQNLQQALQQRIAQPNHLQARCAIREGILLVLVEHLLHLEPDTQQTFLLLEQAVRELVPELVDADPNCKVIAKGHSLPVRLYLRVAGYQQPYAFHAFTLEFLPPSLPQPYQQPFNVSIAPPETTPIQPLSLPNRSLPRVAEHLDGEPHHNPFHRRPSSSLVSSSPPTFVADAAPDPIDAPAELTTVSETPDTLETSSTIEQDAAPESSDETASVLLSQETPVQEILVQETPESGLTIDPQLEEVVNFVSAPLAAESALSEQDSIARLDSIVEEFVATPDSAASLPDVEPEAWRVVSPLSRIAIDPILSDEKLTEQVDGAIDPTAETCSEQNEDGSWAIEPVSSAANLLEEAELPQILELIEEPISSRNIDVVENEAGITENSFDNTSLDETSFAHTSFDDIIIDSAVEEAIEETQQQVIEESNLDNKFQIAELQTEFQETERETEAQEEDLQREEIRENELQVIELQEIQQEIGKDTKLEGAELSHVAIDHSPKPMSLFESSEAWELCEHLGFTEPVVEEEFANLPGEESEENQPEVSGAGAHDAIEQIIENDLVEQEVIEPTAIEPAVEEEAIEQTAIEPAIELATIEPAIEQTAIESAAIEPAIEQTKIEPGAVEPEFHETEPCIFGFLPAEAEIQEDKIQEDKIQDVNIWEKETPEGNPGEENFTENKIEDLTEDKTNIQQADIWSENMAPVIQPDAAIDEPLSSPAEGDDEFHPQSENGIAPDASDVSNGNEDRVEQELIDTEIVPEILEQPSETFMAHTTDPSLDPSFDPAFHSSADSSTSSRADVSPSSPPNRSLSGDATPSSLDRLPLEVSPHRRPSLATIMLSGAIGLFFVTAGGYMLSRPCVVGQQCQPLQNAQQLSQTAFTTIQSDPTALEVVEAHDQLNQAIEDLTTIPSWSRHYQTAQTLRTEYQGKAEVLGFVVKALNQANNAAKKSLNPPHPVPLWREVQWIWKDAIATLEKVPAESVVYPLAQSKLKQYQANLESINHRILAEQQAQDRLDAVKQAANVTTARSQIVDSPDSWQQTAKSWQTLIDQLKQIPQGTSAYIQAQRLLPLYQQNLEAAVTKRDQSQLGATAYNQAIRFTQQARQAEQQSQWSQAVTNWRDAIAELKQIPEGTTYYSQAQTMLASSTTALQKAEATLKQITLTETVAPQLDRLCKGIPTLCSYTIAVDAIRVQFTPTYDLLAERVLLASQNQNGTSLRADTFNQMNQLLRSFAGISTTAEVPLELYNASGTRFATYDLQRSSYVTQ